MHNHEASDMVNFKWNPICAPSIMKGLIAGMQ